MPPTNRDICAYYFTRDAENRDVYWCKCGKRYRQTHGSGYHNLMRHLQADTKNHAKYADEVQLRINPPPSPEPPAKVQKENPEPKPVHNPEPKPVRNPEPIAVLDTSAGLYEWIDWIVAAFLPLSICEEIKHTDLPKISRRTLKRSMEKVQAEVEEVLQQELPPKFGLVLDCWTSADVQYIAIFAVFPETSDHSSKQVLLTFSPFAEERDTIYLFRLITDVLELYERSWTSVLFLVSNDNELILHVQENTEVPGVGCANQRFELAVKTFLEPYGSLISSVHFLMTKFLTVKGRKVLKKETTLMPRLYLGSHWSIAYKMLRRYSQLLPSIRNIKRSSLRYCDAFDVLLTPEQDAQVDDLLIALANLHSVRSSLQQDTLTLSDVRAIFDHTMETYPSTTRYITQDNVVTSTEVERGLIKLQTGDALSQSERKACANFMTSREEDDNPIEEVDDKPLSFVDEAKRKRRKLEAKQPAFMDTDFVPPMSNLCERLLSKSKQHLDLLSQSMKPSDLGVLLFLRANREFWSKEMVHKIAKSVN
ncbi:hypothetical protein P3T76_015488 [Phytophthora citrophthora]|uniref:BED-type domain-containing protein n=1 Tax=Phytophthora citrophthora TaxID=4793 RepID=A0AAD9LA98_9STRA|nr:hypothetical protein P3T76_015488 [Phytophthora citrophthora]